MTFFKKLFISSIFALASAWAQIVITPSAVQLQSYTVAALPSAPTGTVVGVTNGASATDCSTGGGTNYVVCVYNGSSWQAMGGGGSPTGSAGGDLSGTYPNPTVAQVNGAAVPTSAGVVGTNSSKQFTAVTTTGTGNAVLATGPTITNQLSAAIYGGSAAGSTQTLQGTSSGSPSGAYVFVNPNGQFTMFGSSNAPDAVFTVSTNAAVAPGSLLNTPLFHIIGQDSTAPSFTMDAYRGTLGDIYPMFSLRASEGTAASPSAVTTSDFLFILSGSGYNSSGFIQGGQIRMIPTETWTSAHNGTQITFVDTKTGSSGLATVATFDNDGQIYFPDLVNVTGATSGAVCFTSSTGRLTYDNTNTCLASSARFKNSITPYVASALTLVNQLIPVTFMYNSNFFTDTAQHIGLIAEDVNKVEPRLVASDANGPEKLNVQDIIAVLVKSIQEQQAEIVALQNALKTATIAVPSPILPSVAAYVPPAVAPFVPPPPLPIPPAVSLYGQQ